jgi:Family of unknown function (DUF5360)
VVAHLGPADTMPVGLVWSLRLIDYAMLIYWGVSALAGLSLLRLPPSYMYAGYGQPMMGAWNWSFAPLDLIFSLIGLFSLRLARRRDARWRSYTLISMSLTFCAGLMALAFWSIIGFFDASWWTPNLLLMLLGGYWVLRLASGMQAG